MGKNGANTNLTAGKEENLMWHLARAATKMRNSKLEEDKLKGIEPHLIAIMQKSGFVETEREAMVFAMIFHSRCAGDSVSLKEMAEYMDCSIIEAVGFYPEVKALRDRGCVMRCTFDEPSMAQTEYSVYGDIADALIAGKENIKATKGRADHTRDMFCASVNRLCSRRGRNETDTTALMRIVRELEEESDYLPFVKGTIDLLADLTDRMVYYCICHSFLDNNGENSENATVMGCFNRIYDDVPKAAQRGMEALDGKGDLVGSGLVEVRNYMEKDAHIYLTEKGIRLLLGDEADQFIKVQRPCADKFDFVKRMFTKLRNAVPDVDVARNFPRMYTDMRNFECWSEDTVPQISNVRERIPDDGDRALYWILCQQTVTDDALAVKHVNLAYDPDESRKQKKLLKEMKHPLQDKLMEVGRSDFFDNSLLTLTSEGLELFFEDDAKGLAKKPTKTAGIIECKDIKEKRLFFTDELGKQLETIKESIADDKYKELVERLKEKNMPTGVAILLYGYPGTGKTESVLQWARETGRDIMHVNIAETKSCWLGESEKLIKEVFDKYRASCEASKVKPILLFNEADAVFSKRKDIGGDRGGALSALNAMQNIILEEMERLEGILVATTNMTENLDGAFERRFLFKVKFDKPTTDAKARIWKDKLPSLTEDEARKLADGYEFSGGEIDNVARKVLVDEVIKGTKPEIGRIEELCKEEKISKSSSKKIGFRSDR